MEKTKDHQTKFEERTEKAIKCYVTRTVRMDEEGEAVGVVLLMEEVPG